MQVCALAVGLFGFLAPVARLCLLLFFLDNLRNMLESFVDVGACAGTSLEEGHVELFSKSHALLSVYYFLISEICLVSYEDFFHIRVGVNINLPDPVSHIVEALF